MRTTHTTHVTDPLHHSFSPSHPTTNTSIRSPPYIPLRPWQWKTIPLWVWFWFKRLCPSPLFPPILPYCSNFFNLRYRNHYSPSYPIPCMCILTVPPRWTWYHYIPNYPCSRPIPWVRWGLPRMSWINLCTSGKLLKNNDITNHKSPALQIWCPLCVI